MGNVVTKSQAEVEQEKRESLKERAKSECQRRIYSYWDEVGQRNVSMGGVYTDAEEQDCRDCIATHRADLDTLIGKIENGDDVDVTDDSHWNYSE